MADRNLVKCNEDLCVTDQVSRDGWKRRRRKSLPLLKYLCISFALLFFLGNVFLFNGDIFQITTDTYVTKTSVLAAGSAQDLLKNDIFQEMIEIPLAVINSDTKIRHLMGDVYNSSQTRGRGSVITNSGQLSSILSSNSICGQIKFNKTGENFLGSGWTKSVYRGKLNGFNVAVKTVHKGLTPSTNCDQEGQVCFKTATNKIMREIAILSGLKHHNLIQLLGYCIPSENDHQSSIAIATELGEGIDLIRCLQKSWEDRLKLSYGLSKLLYYLAYSPYGSISLNDFRRQQFVINDGDIKLSDVDDVGFGEPQCQSDQDCKYHFTSTNFTLRTPCYSGYCYNFNEKMNIYNTGRHFTTFLLPHGCPRQLRPLIDSITHAFGNASLDIRQLLDMMRLAVSKYSQGLYLDRRPGIVSHPVYKEYQWSDFPGQHDYSCHHSIGSVCSVSVYDRKEAEDLCDMDSQCAGYVLSSVTTWTGRTLAIFKNNFTKPSHNAETTLYVKPGFVT